MCALVCGPVCSMEFAVCGSNGFASVTNFFKFQDNISSINCSTSLFHSSNLPSDHPAPELFSTLSTAICTCSPFKRHHTPQSGSTNAFFMYNATHVQANNHPPEAAGSHISPTPLTKSLLYRRNAAPHLYSTSHNLASLNYKTRCPPLISVLWPTHKWSTAYSSSRPGRWSPTSATFHSLHLARRADRQHPETSPPRSRQHADRAWPT